jgi:hypothetical protein
MITSNTILASAVAAALLNFAAVAQADECEAMTKSVKTLIDKIDPQTKGGNNPAKLCSAYGEGLGLMKSFRVVVDECLDEGDERTKVLAGLDRSIRQLQTEVDKNCE